MDSLNVLYEIFCFEMTHYDYHISHTNIASTLLLNGDRGDVGFCSHAVSSSIFCKIERPIGSGN